MNGGMVNIVTRVVTVSDVNVIVAINGNSSVKSYRIYRLDGC